MALARTSRRHAGRGGAPRRYRSARRRGSRSRGATHRLSHASRQRAAILIMSPHTQLSIAQRGFTLLEVLVAVAVFSVFSVLAYAGVTRIIEGRDRVEAERERWRTLTLAFAQMEDDLAQARPRSVRDTTGLNPLPAFAGQPVDPRPLGDPSIEFTRGGM